MNKVPMRAHWYSDEFCYLMNILDPRVHRGNYCCEWVAPYGFVPEACCPEHD